MPSRRLQDCLPALQAGWEALAKAFHSAYPGWKAVVVCTHRPPEEQLALFAKGRRQRPDKSWAVEDEAKIVTYKDGFKLRGRHNDFPARALDIELFTPAGDKFWDTHSRGIAEHAEGLNPWCWLRDKAPKHGLENGGSWKTFKDWPHFQLA